MKTYKTVEKKVKDRIYCDACGQCCTEDNIGDEYGTLEAVWGYGSKHDGTKYNIDLCEDCFFKVVESIKDKRRRVLGPFNYAYDKDPLNGETYNIT
jgi:hypothetical protein